MEEVTMATKKTESGRVAPTFSPSLVFPHGKKYSKQSFYTLSDGNCYPKSIPELRRMCCFTCSHGWLLMLHCFNNPRPCYLFNPVSSQKIHLPPIATSRPFPYTHGIIVTADDNDSDLDLNNNCVVMLISEEINSCLFCHVDCGGARGGSTTSTTWIQQDLEEPPRNKIRKDRIIEGIRNVISCKGKVYILYNYGIVIVNVNFRCLDDLTADTDEAALTITIKPMRLPDKFTMPNVVLSCMFLVESRGDIFLVDKIYLGTTSQIRTLEVNKLDLSSMVWTKVDTLGDRIFLLSTNSISISASKQLGQGGNCIYFCDPDDTSLYRFDMSNGCITVTQPCPNVVRKWDWPYWLVPHQLPTPCPNMIDECQYAVLVPNDNLLVKQQETKVVETIGQQVNEEWSLNDLEMEHLELILKNLYLGDCIRFRLTCKTWLSITPPLRSGSAPFLIQSGSGFRQPPWLMSIQKKNELRCKFHHPIYNDTYLTDFPELADAFSHHSKYGWLLMSRPNSSFFFFSPLTGTTIELPELPEQYYCSFVGMSFSSPPTSSNCIVFGHQASHTDYVLILVYRLGKNEWERFEIDNKVSFFASYCNPVFFDGFFYCLGQDGKLSVFKIKDGLEPKFTWRVFPKIIGPNMSIHRCFLVECDGQILSVFIGRLGTPICVCMLDRSEMKWVKVKSLGGKVLFLSHTTSILAPAGLKGIENKIYLPTVSSRSKQSLFYSLQTGKYHSFGSKDPREDWMDTQVEWQHTWIEFNTTNTAST